MAENFATAPYNFVSLPEKILPSPIEDIETYKKQIQSAELLSGEIELEIESLTPLFIGGNGEKSFAPVKEIIPGSSLRGMLKNIFKIVTCSTFRGGTGTQKKGEDFNDEHIYYRCLMKNNQAAWENGYNWSADLNKNHYSKRMTSTTFVKGKRKVQKKAIPGFLIKTSEGKYFIAPLYPNCYEGREPIHDRKFKNLQKSCVLWEKDKAYIFTGKGSKKKVVRYTEIGDIDWNKKNWLELSDEVRKSYENDRNRGGVNLFEQGILARREILKFDKKVPAEVQSIAPCHFLKKDNQITAFGHGQYFRIPYEKSVGEVVEQTLPGAEIIDFADAVFGRSDFWSSRVFFEDAIISAAKTLPSAVVKPLMQPNPTSYQLYLQQENENSLSHWDSPNAKIRGYKMYWHNGVADWQAGEIQNENLIKKITPLDAGNKFKSKIRFENLSKVELGALLMIFELNGAKNPAYKIGMGKPLGLGSVKISSKLFVENESAYTEIFDGDVFKNPYREENFSEYLAAFKNYVEERGLKSVWEKVMRELNLILDWDNTKKAGWREKIKSMSGDVQSGEVDEKFIKRAPLQTIFEVVK